jgi:hypothetical protein
MPFHVGKRINKRNYRDLMPPSRPTTTDADKNYQELKKKVEDLSKRVDLLIVINNELLARYA